MNRLAGETACPTHRQMVWRQCGGQCCLPSAVFDRFFRTFSPFGLTGPTRGSNFLLAHDGPTPVELLRKLSREWRGR